MKFQNIFNFRNKTVYLGIVLMVLAGFSARVVSAETDSEKKTREAAEKVQKQQAEADKKAKEAAEKIKKQQAEADKKAKEAQDKIKRQHDDVLNQIQSKADEFKGGTEFTSKELWVVHQDFLGISTLEGDIALIVKFNRPAKFTPKDVSLTFKCFVNGEKFKDKNELAFSVDKTPLPVEGTPSYKTEQPVGITTEGAVYEILGFTVPYATFQTVANGTKVKGRLGETEFEIKDRNLLVLKEMLLQSAPLPALPVAAPAKAK